MQASVTEVNPDASTLIQLSLDRNESKKSANGALYVETGSRTGRSPHDKFIVQDALTQNTVDWGAVNRPISSANFEKLWCKAQRYMEDKEILISDLQVGADAQYGVSVKMMTEYAWHHLFGQHLFIRPEENPHVTQKNAEDTQWTVVNLPGLATSPEQDGVNSDAAVLLDFSQKRILILHMRYAGEMKKAMFTVLNFALPDRDVLPMHCAANVDAQGRNAALFFGLSGTGKTTLSADLDRQLIGDDEHGWSQNGIFNFEGGCYAKCIDLTAEREPVIYQAIRDGALMENVVVDAQGQPDFSDVSLTRNTRVAYPLTHIKQRVVDSRGPHPRSVLFLTCDLHGVLPPVSCLNLFQAAYYFLSGYTALIGSTEVGSQSDIEATFSTCFGAPFFPRPPKEYAHLLMRRLEQTGARVYLVNTGWTGGGYHTGGRRFSIATTRKIVSAITSGALETVETVTLPVFNLAVPVRVPDVSTHLLLPENGWEDKEAYHRHLSQLAHAFIANFQHFDVSQAIRAAGPAV